MQNSVWKYTGAVSTKVTPLNIAESNAKTYGERPEVGSLLKSNWPNERGLGNIAKVSESSDWTNSSTDYNTKRRMEHIRIGLAVRKMEEKIRLRVLHL